MPRLQILNGKRQGATIDIGRGETVVGHRNTAPVCIDDPWVSWDHARLFFQNDTFWIEDLGSTNGTYVNCVRVKRERLTHEDIVFFGKTHVIFLVPEVAGEGAGGGSSLDGKRSDFEIGVEQLAAAAEQWTQPPPRSGARSRTTQESPRNRNDLLAAPTGSAAPAIPVPAGERSDPLRLAGLRGDADESSGPADPWRAGPSPDSDPFASARASAATDPFIGEHQSHVRAFADTHLDGEALDGRGRAGARSPNLEDFAIDDQDPGDGTALAPASAAEVASLLDRKDTDAPMDDLDALLGDNAARTPDPGLFRIPAAGRRKSEALTRPVDSASAAREVEEASSPTDRIPSRPASGTGAARRPSTLSRATALPPPPLPMPSPSGTSRFAGPPLPREAAAPPATPLSGARTQTMTTPVAPRVPMTPGPPPGRTQSSSTIVSPEAFANLAAAAPPTRDDSRPIAAGEAAFEAARLQDEVRRLRAALEATKAEDPERVRIAAEAMRDQELGRQAREIADLRRELAEVKHELAAKQTELDDVTEDMIKKEDTIDDLRRRVGAAQGGRGPSSLAPAKTQAVAAKAPLADSGSGEITF